MTHTIVFSSRAILPDGNDPNVKPEWLDTLVERAAIRNKSFNVSGVLSYKSGKFMHLIEGEPEQIQNLFAKILGDRRHHNVFTLLDIKDSQRIFSDWSLVLEPNVDTSSLFQKFLFAHFDELVEMTNSQSDELIFFVDHVFNEFYCKKEKIKNSDVISFDQTR